MADTTPLLRRQHKKLLRALALYQHLTREQAIRGAGYGNSKGFVINTLTYLTNTAGYTIKHNMPDSPGPNPAGLWMFSEAGLEYMKTSGLVDIDDLPGYSPNPSEFFRNHIHAINNVLIGLAEWATTTPGVQLIDFQHDHMLKRRPIGVPIDGRNHHTSADGLVEFRAPGLDEHGHLTKFEYRLWLELDRGTEDDKQWKRKVDLLVRYAETVPDEPLMVMVVVNLKPPSNPQRRMLQLRSWTETVLKSANKRQWADLFRFRTIGNDEIPYGEFFTHPHWVRPFDDQLYPLIDAPEEVS